MMTKDEMIGWFRAAPMGSRHQRMLWAARKIARLTGVTEGGAYQMLLVALLEAERRLPDEYQDVFDTDARSPFALIEMFTICR